MPNRYDNKWVVIGMNKEEQCGILNGQMSSEKVGGESVGHNHSKTNPGNGGILDAVDIEITPPAGLFSTTLKTIIDELKGLIDLGRTHVPVRQTVLYGSVDQSTGQANFLTTSAGLTVNILGAATPIVVAFAYNFDSTFGQLDYIEPITSDVTAAWSSLPTNSTCFLYIDRNVSTGGLTYGYSLLSPTYATIAPTSPSTDQHWFDLNSFYMKRWNGTVWENKQRVFVGEAITGASNVSSIIIYALKGKYNTGDFSAANGSSNTKNHNIGVNPEYIQWSGIQRNSTKTLSTSIGFMGNNTGTGSVEAGPSLRAWTKNSVNVYAGVTYAFYGSTLEANAYYNLTFSRAF